MDEFQTSAKQMRMRQTLIVGATFGIFLTIGNAWSVFLETAVTSFVPDSEDEVLRQFIYATMASSVCLGLLFLIIKCNKYVNVAERSVNKKNIKNIIRAVPGINVHENVQTDGRMSGKTVQANIKRNKMRTTRDVRQGYM